MSRVDIVIEPGKVAFPSPLGIFFICIGLKNENVKKIIVFPSPLGIFFICILSSGSLSEKGEMLHFAVKNHFPY